MIWDRIVSGRTCDERQVIITVDYHGGRHADRGRRFGATAFAVAHQTRGPLLRNLSSRYSTQSPWPTAGSQAPSTVAVMVTAFPAASMIEVRCPGFFGRVRPEI